MSRDDTNIQAETSQRFSDCAWGHTKRDKRNNKRFILMCVLWAACFIGVDMIQEKTTVSDTVAWVLAFLPALPAIGALAAYVRFLLEADEMVRAVQLHGLALGFGVAVLMMVGVQWPTEQPRWMDQDMILAVMMFGWAGGSVWAMWRMR